MSQRMDVPEETDAASVGEEAAESAEETEPEPATEEIARSYVEVRPTERPLTPSRAADQFRRLHALDTGGDDGLLSRLLGMVLPDGPPPTVEILLVSPGESNAIRYFIGVDESEGKLLEALETVLRSLFPNEYEFHTYENCDPTVAQEESTSVTGVEYYGEGKRLRDWQTPLTSVADLQDEDDVPQLPLSAVVEAMAGCRRPVIYQALIRAKPDWTMDRDMRRVSLEKGDESYRTMFWNAVRDSQDDDSPISVENQERLDSIKERDARWSFVVTARAAVLDDDSTPYERGGADPAVQGLATAFGDVAGTYHEVNAKVRTGDGGLEVLEAIRERRFHEPSYERAWTKIPFTKNWSRGIVADRTEVGNFCLVGGRSLTADGDRALGTTPDEQASVPRPPDAQLDQYAGEGLPLGVPQTADGTTSQERLSLPPSLQRLHVAMLGTTGTGKTTAMTNAVLENHVATDGADIVVSPIGDGLAFDYLRAHYARHGDLDDVIYFDCAEWLPAISFFDVRKDLDAGVSRTTAVENRVDHYVEILEAVMGEEKFNSAVRSPSVVRYLAKAGFDPACGGDAFGHDEILEMAQRMATQQSPPTVSSDRLQRSLNGVAANTKKSFKTVMAGAINRMESIGVDRRLGTLFDHVATEDAPAFDIGEYLNEDVVIVFNTNGVRPEAQGAFALVVLSELWTALRRRKHRSEGPSPLVNLYVEEAASLGNSDLLGDILSKGRGLDCSVTMALQFTRQLHHDAPDLQDELLNDVGTIMAGPVPSDRRLAERLASGAMDADEVANRLRALNRGEWLLSLPAEFGETPPRPFQVESLPVAPGVRNEDDVLEDPGFDQAWSSLIERTRSSAALDVPMPDLSEDDEDDLDPHAVRLDSALPHTERLPKPVRYDEERHALRCANCDGRHGADLDGMRRAIECCSSMEHVSRDSVPICDLGLKLSAEECTEVEQSTRQLLFLQAVYNAQRQRYEPPAYDLLRDSMTVLREYVGIDKAAVEELVEMDLLVHETDYPHRLYSVTPEGRDLIGERYREGLDFGDGLGDMHESTEHRMAVELARRYLEAEYVDDPDSPVVEVRPYHDGDGRERLDVAGLDDDGTVRVAVEVERMNGRQKQAVPEDYDKLAEYDLDEAIWLVMSEDDAHELLRVLNDPADGVPRVEKTYSESTRSQYFNIDTDGLTEVFIVDHIREELGIQ